jgi:hypothetical protein
MLRRLDSELPELGPVVVQPAANIRKAAITDTKIRLFMYISSLQMRPSGHVKTGIPGTFFSMRIPAQANRIETSGVC